MRITRLINVLLELGLAMSFCGNFYVGMEI